MSSTAGITDDIKASVLSVGSVFVLAVVGFFLFNRGAMTPVSIKSISSINTWAVLPLYALMKLGGFLNTSNIMYLVYIIIAQQFCIHFGYALMMISNCILPTDIRAKLPLLFITAAGNIVVLPALIVQSMCEPGGRLSSSKYC